MTQPDPDVVPEDLDEYLQGEEPDWDAEPTPPPDERRANALLRRVAAIRAERTRDTTRAQEQHDQIDAWLNARDEARTRQEAWLLAALERYHRAVLVLNPKRVTIDLPAGKLTSNAGQPTWELTDEDAFLAWLLPPEWAKARTLAGELYVSALGHIVQLLPLPDAVRLKPIPEPELDRNGMKKALTRTDEKGKPLERGVTVNGERPPGLTVKPAERTFDVKLPEPPAEPTFTQEQILAAVSPRPILRDGRLEHPSACYDDEGKLECVCGLDEEQERYAEYAAARLEEAAERERREAGIADAESLGYAEPDWPADEPTEEPF